ncbi:MAG: hypothetical protein IIA44_01955, partial [Acidobacteria bacterium]|nr:hypothetical protein [Acidobacteriota bacterium]
APYPALVTVGHLNDSLLLLDLEHLGAVQITGDTDQVTATCHTMATELAASPIADTLQVVCVGFGEDLQHLERITVVDQLTDILPTIEAKEAATATQNVTPFEGRLAPWGGDSWSPMIIFDPSEHRPRGGDRLLDAAHRGRAVCAVVGYPTGGQWRLHLSGDTIRIHPLGYTYQRRNLTPTEQADVADLTHTAKSLDGIPQTVTTGPSAPLVPADPNEDSIGDDTARESDDDSKSSSPAGGPILELRTLGTVAIEGSTEGIIQPKSLELVTYLAFHRNGVEADTLMEALWPEQPPDYPRLNRHTSRTRTTLGHGPDGEPYLPYVSDGIYRISPHVRSDLDEFTRHIQQADRVSASEEVEHLRAALELVEGTPFTGAGNAYTWAHTDGIITHTTVTIDNTAHRLAQLALQNDTPDQATWAARRGLIATGACEECYRSLMRAAIAEGNQVAFEAVYAELLAVVDADEGPDVSTFLDPETIDLYEQQSRKRRRQAG